MENINLNVIDIEKDLVYIMCIVCILFYMSGNTYKINSTENNKLAFTFNATLPVNYPIASTEVVKILNVLNAKSIYIRL